MASQHFAPLPAVRPVPILPMMPSEKIMLAYRDPHLSQSDFEALVREIYGDFPEDE